MKPTSKTILVEIPESAFEAKRGAAFGGVFELGLAIAVRNVDGDLSPVDADEIKDDLRGMASRCAAGLAGIGSLMSFNSAEIPAETIGNLVFLIEDLALLVDQSLDQIEALEISQRRAAGNKKPRKVANIAGLSSTTLI